MTSGGRCGNVGIFKQSMIPQNTVHYAYYAKCNTNVDMKILKDIGRFVDLQLDFCAMIYNTC